MSCKRILVVDDSPTERMVLSALLTEHGHVVETACSGEEALARVMHTDTAPEVIIMDVVMPGINGYQATRQLSRDERTRRIPVILCTSKDQEADRVWGMRQGASGYLTKPVNPGQLLAAIAALPASHE